MPTLLQHPNTANLGQPRSAPNRRALAIVGSLRAHSYNRLLVEAAARVAPATLDVDIYDELAAIPLFDEDLEVETAGGPDAVRRLRARVAAADALLLATPEYNQSIPAVLKNVLDWLSRPGPDDGLAGKPVAVVGITTGRWGTRLAQAATRQVLGAMGALVLPRPMLFAADAAALFDESGRLVNPATSAQLRAVMVALEEWIARVAPPLKTPGRAVG